MIVRVRHPRSGEVFDLRPGGQRFDALAWLFEGTIGWYFPPMGGPCRGFDQDDPVQLAGAADYLRAHGWAVTVTDPPAFDTLPRVGLPGAY